MPLQATSGAASYDAFGGGVAAVPNYIEDVFSTWLYTGNGSTQTINNGIDLAGKGGLVWTKNRLVSGGWGINLLIDTARGLSGSSSSGYISSNNTNGASGGVTPDFSSFNSNGYSLGAPFGLGAAALNGSGNSFVSWTFRKQPKFFDVVTYTGNGTAGLTVAHNLGSVPGFVVIKRLNSSGSWPAIHRNNGTNWLQFTFNATDNGFGPPLANWFGNGTSFVAPTSTNFTVGTNTDVNASGGTYVAYLFAHNAGGFGLTGTDNVISCGSFSAPSGNATVTLGYEPQYILWKRTDAAQNWNVYDTMRGWAQTQQAQLYPNLTQAEDMYTGSPYFFPTATGFQLNSSFGLVGDYIYIAIRRGPMRTPTSSTGLYSANRYQYNSGYAGGLTTTTVSGAAGGFGGFPTDLVINTIRNQSGDTNRQFFLDRLRGIPGLWSTQTYAESSPGAPGSDAKWDNMVGVTTSGYPYYVFTPYIFTNYFLRRAPSFFDEVCYTGNSTARTINHNLSAVPELMIVKARTGIARDWAVYTAATTATNFMYLNATDASGASSTMWNDTTPTASVFTVGTNIRTNNSGQDYVAYLFASCPNVSKVGSYTGTGSTQTINCGFTGGARFVMIKRTDSTGNWWIWDTVDGMVAGTNPRIPMNTTTAEANNDWVFTTAGGFQIVTTDATVNASGGTYIFLAIA